MAMNGERLTLGPMVDIAPARTAGVSEMADRIAKPIELRRGGAPDLVRQH
jgi:hypothetical protein